MGNTTSVNGVSGHALILSHDKFPNRDHLLNDRNGNKMDVDALERSLKLRGFEVTSFCNLTTSEVKQKVKYVAEEGEFAACACLVVVVATHGNQGGVLYSHDSQYYTSDVWGPLVDCRNFRGKPKIIVFQACRGGLVEGIMNSGTFLRSDSLEESPDKKYTRLPHDPHFLLAFSTAENRLSIRNKNSGTWYLQSLCKELELLESQDDVLSVLTRVTFYVVGQGMKGNAQTPSVISFLPYEINLQFVAGPVLTEGSTQPPQVAGDLEKDSVQTPSNKGPGHKIPAPVNSAQHLTTDGVPNKSLVKPRQSHYEWAWPRRGRAIILFTPLHRKDAERVANSARSLDFKTQLLEIEDCESFDVLNTVAADPSLDNDGSLLVAVLATIEEERQHRETNFSIGDTLFPIRRVWRPFIASRCPSLHDKPKIFLFLDNLNVHDCARKEEKELFHDAPQESATLVTEHADFFFVYGYGSGFIGSLSDSLEKDGRSLELHKVVTRAVNGATGSEKMENLPHFESNLKLMLKFEPVDLKSPRGTKRPLADVPIECSLYDEADNVEVDQRMEKIIASCKQMLGADLNPFENGGNYNAKDNYGRTALYLFARSGKLDVVAWFHENGADISLQNKMGERALHVASKNGRLATVQWLVEHGADVNGKSKKGESALHAAALCGELELIKYLVGQGANIGSKDKEGETPLHVATKSGELDVAKWLLENGADINVKDKSGNTALHVTADYGELDVIKWLIEQGSNIDAKNDNGETALHKAAYSGELEAVKCLVNLKANVNAKDSDGDNALHKASRAGNLDLVVWLVERGGDVNAKNNMGWTPHFMAALFSHTDIFQFMVHNGAELIYTESEIKSTIHKAASLGSMEWIQALIEDGVDVNRRNDLEETALFVAAKHGQLGVVKSLVEAWGADINAWDCRGRTAVHEAACTDNLEMLTLLLQLGADVNVSDNEGNSVTDDDKSEEVKHCLAQFFSGEMLP